MKHIKPYKIFENKDLETITNEFLLLIDNGMRMYDYVLQDGYTVVKLRSMDKISIDMVSIILKDLLFIGGRYETFEVYYFIYEYDELRISVKIDDIQRL